MGELVGGLFEKVIDRDNAAVKTGAVVPHDIEGLDAIRWRRQGGHLEMTVSRCRVKAASKAGLGAGACSSAAKKASWSTACSTVRSWAVMVAWAAW